MTQPASRLRAWSALLLAGTLLAAGGLSAAAQDPSEDGAQPSPATSQAPSVEPVPSATPASSAEPAPAFASVPLRTVLLTDDLETPVYVADDGVPGRCLYAVEKGGKVWLIDRVDGSKLFDDPFLDLSGQVATGPEQGLHSIAFHPGFTRKGGKFYARWDNPKGRAVVAEFKGRACRPEPEKGRKIERKWVNEKQEYANNNAGWIGFGPDDMLYVTLGDGGGSPPGDAVGNGQSKTSPLAKVLRIDVRRRDGLAEGNPYVQNARGKLKKRGNNYPRTWVMGVRDPRRASFDRATGDFWFGDVGQLHYDRPGWEEVNLVPADSVKSGQQAPNFGWSEVEGVDTCNPSFPECDPEAYVAPVFSYEKPPGCTVCAITGGYVYRGKDEGLKRLQGVYLFSDFIDGTIWGLDAEAARAGDEVTAYPLLEAPQGFVSFGEDDQGELYVVALEGSVYRLSAGAR